jgi:polyferredoxin
MVHLNNDMQQVLVAVIYFFIFAAILMAVWNMFIQNLYAGDTPSTLDKRKMNYGTALGITALLMLVYPPITQFRYILYYGKLL